MLLVGASSSAPSPLWYATRGAGVAVLVLLTATVVLGIVTSIRWEGRRTPRFVVASVHRNLSLFALLLLLVHITTSVLDPFAGITWIDSVVPFAGAYRTFWLGLGVLAAEGMVAVAVSSLVRGRIGPRVWKLIHWLAYASWPVAILHGLGTGSDAQAPWMLGLTAACVAAVLAALARRLLYGRMRTLPVRMVAAGGAAVATVAVCAWAVAGPLQPGWAARAGTPTTIVSAPTPVATGPFEDPLVGTLVRTASGQAEIALRDTVNTSVTIEILPPGSNQSLPVVTVRRGSATLCTAPARVTATFYAVCGKVRLVIALVGRPPNIGGTLTGSGPLG
jgi:sulfoxide reductase heme-binding subunit YedZ